MVTSATMGSNLNTVDKRIYTMQDLGRDDSIGSKDDLIN